MVPHDISQKKTLDLSFQNTAVHSIRWGELLLFFSFALLVNILSKSQSKVKCSIKFIFLVATVAYDWDVIQGNKHYEMGG